MPTQSELDNSTPDECFQDDLDLPEHDQQSQADEGTSRLHPDDLRQITQGVVLSIATPSDGIDFTVEKSTIVETDPPEYRLGIQGAGTLEVTSATLLNRTAFKRRYMERFRRVPTIRDNDEVWTCRVNQWLAAAEVVEMPPEASEAGRRRELVEIALTKDPVQGESWADLVNLGKWVETENRRAFHLGALCKRIKKDDDHASQQSIATILRDMAYESRQVRVDGHSVRVWLAPEDEEDEL